MASNPHLHTLAARMGILPSYISQSGVEHRLTSDETRVAILRAMGIDAPNEEAAFGALRELDERERARITTPVRVVRDADGWDSTIRFRVPDVWGLRVGERVEYACELRSEVDGGGEGVAREVGGGGEGGAVGGGGVVLSHEGTAELGEGGVVNVGLAPIIGPGYYRLRLTICSQGRTREAEQTLIVAPSACVTPSRRSFGIVANLYSVRSARNWGVGNLGDLGELARWSGERGATFVGVNPLHAIRNRGGEVSPYNPVSRLYRNPIYLDIEAIPELVDCAEARAMLASESVRAELARLRAGDHVAYERIASLERPILAALHRAFVERNAGDPGTLGPRGRAYAVYLEREGAALTAFALFQTLDEHFARSRVVPPTWHEWPAPYRNPASPEVAAFRESHELEVDFHRWLQFELDSQLALAALSGRRAGLSMGLYQDLAVASAASGSDAWAHQNLFAIGVSIGAPPDNYSAIGQDWGAPPLNPHRLFEDRYRYWIALVRSALRHAGALRIDHVLGLFRQFWIPAGMTGERGAYVRFPTNDLLGIVALESLRHRAVIVGEDLGTVPAEVPGILGQWGILGTRVMFFERETDGAFRPASSYEPLALATADTHDMPTVAGFWQERDIDLKRELGLLKSGAEERAARLARERDRLALLARLTADGALPSGGAPPSGTELRGAVHRFICSTPAVLAGISLDDITGETDQVNVPGLGADTFPSWTRRMRAPLESLEASPEVDEALRCAR